MWPGQWFRLLRQGAPNPGVQPRAERVGCNDALDVALFERPIERANDYVAVGT